MPTKCNSHPIKLLLLALIVSVFVGETLVMLFLDLLPPLSQWHEALLDATLLLVLIFPAIYFLVFRPLKTQLAKQIEAETTQQKTLESLQKIASQVPGIVFQLHLSPDGNFYLPYANESLSTIYRISPEDLREDASAMFAVVHPDDLGNHLDSLKTSAQNLTPWVQQYRLKFSGDPVCWLHGNALPQRLDDGSILWHGFITDITERKQAEMEIHIAETVFESHEGMLITDANETILRVNQAFTDITGYQAEEVIGKNPRILQSGLHDKDFYAAMWTCVNNTGTWEGEVWNRRKHGEIYPEHLTIATVKNQDGIVTNYVATITDITLNKASVEKIERLAFFDPLTGLPNRVLLMDRLRPALALSHRKSRHGALMFIDMDNFKTLNDTLGHDMGDLLLQQVAQRLTSCVREGDTVARLGGDEFVVLLGYLSKKSHKALAQTEIIGNKILAALNHPYPLSEFDYHSTSSIGATLFNGYEKSVEELLKQADIAMYQAKASGRNTLRFFDPQMQQRIDTRASLEMDLRLALAENQFELYYQPQVHLSGQIIGAEVLIRWQHPQRGLVPPNDFIPLAEENGLIVPIGLWVLETACAQIKSWESNMHTQHLQLAVNVSAHQFHQSDFVKQVLQILHHHAIKPDRLKLELTETLIIDDIDDTIIKMHALREIGVRFSMDDFGTGYSSLSSLKKLPIDQLKIDQSFVRDLVTDPDDGIIVQTIIAMAKNMGMEVIAEGVETESQRAFLEQRGCPVYQGYLFGKPMPLLTFEQLLQQTPHNHADELLKYAELNYGSDSLCFSTDFLGLSSSCSKID